MKKDCIQLNSKVVKVPGEVEYFERMVDDIVKICQVKKYPQEGDFDGCSEKITSGICRGNVSSKIP